MPDRIDKEGRPFTIRPLETGDRAALERMYADFEPKRGAQGLPPANPVQTARWLDSVMAHGHHLVVETESVLVGHGMLLPFEADTAELANFLHQSARDRGIGTDLNRDLIALARQHQIRRIWLSVEPSNRRAIRSYEKAGFRRRAVTLWAPEIEMEFEV